MTQHEEQRVVDLVRQQVAEHLKSVTDPARRKMIERKLAEITSEPHRSVSPTSRLLSAPTSDTVERVWTFRANDGDWDRYNDRLSVSGWQLDAFNANRGPILYNHEAGDGGFLGMGDKKVLPIGKGRAYVKGDALLVDITFDPLDPFAQKVEQKVRDGYLNAVSVRYSMKKYHENERGGFDCFEQELLEISIVTIPGNQRALRVTPAEKSAAGVIDVPTTANAAAKALGVAPSDIAEVARMAIERVEAMQQAKAIAEIAVDAALATMTALEAAKKEIESERSLESAAPSYENGRGRMPVYLGDF